MQKRKSLQTLKKNTLVYKHHYTNKLYEVKFKIVRKSIKLLAETWYMVIKQKNQLNAIEFVLGCCTKSASVDQLEINEFI